MPPFGREFLNPKSPRFVVFQSTIMGDFGGRCTPSLHLALCLYEAPWQGTALSGGPSAQQVISCHTNRSKRKGLGGDDDDEDEEEERQHFIKILQHTHISVLRCNQTRGQYVIIMYQLEVIHQLNLNSGSLQIPLPNHRVDHPT